MVALIPRACPSCQRIMPGTPNATSIELDRDLNFIGRDKSQRSPWQWLRCPECTLDYVCLGPSTEWMKSIYQSSGETPTDLDELASNTAMELWSRYVALAEEKFRVLELGCGRGHFLMKLKQQGHSVLGLEPNESLRKSSKLASTEIVDPGSFLGSATSYQVLSAQLSLEHLQEPYADFQKLRPHLTNDALVFIMYHDGDGLPHQILGEESPLWDIQHLQIFNSEALEIFLKRLGFKVEVDQGYSNNYPLSYWGSLMGFRFPKWALGCSQWKLKMPAGNRVCVARAFSESKE